MSNSAIKDSGERTEFPTGSVRDMHEGKGRMDLLPWNAIIRVSQHCEDGAKKYGEHNVDLGIPMHSLIDSGMRHTAKFLTGMDDEPHLVAACWNLMWALEMELTKPEMKDVPWKPKTVGSAAEWIANMFDGDQHVYKTEVSCSDARDV